MKENTKFLWMYVGILLSFAMILIVFAGLSRNFDEEETVGLKNNVISVTEKNAALELEKAELQNQVNDLTNENAVRVAVDEALFYALQAYDVGDEEKVSQYLATIDPLTLTEAQLYVYNKLTLN